MRALCGTLLAAVLIATASTSGAQAPPPPPPPDLPPVDCVFYGPQDARVIMEGEAVVKANADWIVSHGVTALTLTGHADMVEARMDAAQKRAGEENAIALSRKRAEGVRDALYADGVPRTVTINIVAAGSSAPRKPEHLSQSKLDALASVNDDDRWGLDGEVMNRAACVAY